MWYIAANLLVNRHPICVVIARRNMSVVRRANTGRECNDRSLTGSPTPTFTRIIRPTLIHAMDRTSAYYWQWCVIAVRNFGPLFGTKIIAGGKTRSVHREQRIRQTNDVE